MRTGALKNLHRVFILVVVMEQTVGLSPGDLEIGSLNSSGFSHYFVYYDGAKIWGYKDGILANPGGTSYSLNISSTFGIKCGFMSAYSSQLVGYLDEIAVWTHATSYVPKIGDLYVTSPPYTMAQTRRMIQ